MARLEFASALTRHVACDARDTSAHTLGAAIDEAVQATPLLRGYLFDDQGGLRKHVAVFVNGVLHRDRANLGRVLADEDRIFIAQALTGG
ncbi:MAG TPA: MoaD/ThiS family protein [Burkholderiaceae bacterium]|nr:MoaD/ThiS family protein [Burkholderiaceae bacterium]